MVWKRIQGVASDAVGWVRAPGPAGFDRLPPLAAWDRHIRRVLPFVIAVPAGLAVEKYLLAPADLGYDAQLYVAAATAWLHGGDPWAVTSRGVPFAAPPPTLLAVAPFTVLPDWLVVPVFVLGSLALALAAIRALRLPLWWLGFSPILGGILSGNPDVAVLALLVVAGRRLDALAPILKIYAVLPMVADRRWRSLAICAAVLAGTTPILPWGMWIRALPQTAAAFEQYAATTSVSGDLPLMVIGAVALLSMGVRRAGWLAVPVLWPWTQPHYLALSTPALTPFLAVIWTLPLVPPQLMLASIVVAAIGARFFPAPESDDGETGRVGAPSAWGGWRTASWPRASRP